MPGLTRGADRQTVIRPGCPQIAHISMQPRRETRSLAQRSRHIHAQSRVPCPGEHAVRHLDMRDDPGGKFTSTHRGIQPPLRTGDPGQCRHHSLVRLRKPGPGQHGQRHSLTKIASLRGIFTSQPESQQVNRNPQPP
jgi:hypothetical protein